MSDINKFNLEDNFCNLTFLYCLKPHEISQTYYTTNNGNTLHFPADTDNVKVNLFHKITDFRLHLKKM